MKHLLLILFVASTFYTASAQEKHFVFIQSETKQPFYAFLNGKIYSSTTTGYVIIPKITAGEYNTTIGFPANIFPEQGFRFSVSQKDIGFILRNFGEKGWGLFNWQTSAVIMASEVKSSASVIIDVEKPKEEYKPEISFERNKEVPAFKTEVKQPLDTPVAISTPPVEVNVTDNATSLLPTASAVLAPVSSATIPAQNSEPLREDKAASNASTSKSITSVSNNKNIKKLEEVKGNMGIYLTYIDYGEKTRDTVQLIIPLGPSNKTPATEISARNNSSANKEKSGKNDDLKFLNLEAKSHADSTVPKEGNASPGLANSNCSNIASESDYNKLRRKISLQSTDEAKIVEAQKFFKNECFTTDQLKKLSTLFLSDEGRYKFFDASYNFVTDIQSYSALEKEFIDPYYITRFKAMLRQ